MKLAEEKAGRFGQTDSDERNCRTNGITRSKKPACDSLHLLRCPDTILAVSSLDTIEVPSHQKEMEFSLSLCFSDSSDRYFIPHCSRSDLLPAFAARPAYKRFQKESNLLK